MGFVVVSVEYSARQAAEESMHYWDSGEEML